MLWSWIIVDCAAMTKALLAVNSSSTVRQTDMEHSKERYWVVVVVVAAVALLVVIGGVATVGER